LPDLRKQEGFAALAWEEFDFKERLWTAPAARMKAGKEHRVPLSDSAAAIVQELRKTRLGDFVFPGQRAGKPLSNMAMLKLLERMGWEDLTIHGFRSTFRDWAAEQTNLPREVAEMALAHTIGDRVEAAYRRGDLFEKRRELMEEWERYCLSGPSPIGASNEDGAITVSARQR
jgi:integrase